MKELSNIFDTKHTLQLSDGRSFTYYSLPALERAGIGKVSRLPVSIRIVLESLIRNFDGKKVDEKSIRDLASWSPTAERTEEIPFTVARVLLQDFTGVPLGVDLAAMRSAVARLGKDPNVIQPLVPVDLVIDHSVQVDFSSRADAYRLNMEMEFKRNTSRYQFLKWCAGSLTGFNVVPPGIGICHQVNLEYLADGIIEREGVLFPDSLVGTDSHTTMINGLGVVGWGVGGIEAEAAMLGQPVYFLTPDVVGVHLTGKMKPGATATDLVLHITQLLRKHKVVGKFVEFFGEGAASLTIPDRATISNMCPEYGATCSFFPVDEKTCDYLTATGRSSESVTLVREYFKAQQMFGMPKKGECDYSVVVELDLGEITPSVAGPRRPQDRIPVPELKGGFTSLLQKPTAEGGYNKAAGELSKRYETKNGAAPDAAAGGGLQASDSLPTGAGNQSPKNTSLLTEAEMMNNRPTPDRVAEFSAPGEAKALLQEEFGAGGYNLGHGDVVIAAITSCTNTSNPSVMIGAGLVAKKAAERGLKVNSSVKASLAPGSRVVTAYYEKSGLQQYLDQIGFHLVGYGCTTCIGNSGPLDPRLEKLVTDNDIIVASVLSGNRNFEARVHQSVKANFLMSPPLVVAYALAGTVNIDFDKDPLGRGKDGSPVYLKDLWPTPEEIASMMPAAFDPELYRSLYSPSAQKNELWESIPSESSVTYRWDTKSTYIQEPPYFERFSAELPETKGIENARALAIFGDSVTTDHISPAGSIKASSPAGLYLQANGVSIPDFNSYGARRGSHDVMVRGTFANVRIKNLMVPGTEGGITLHQPSGEKLDIYNASCKYIAEGTPLVVIAGKEYGTGSSRDWAAKGTALLGVRAVIAESFERIHRSNLVGMGVLPCQFADGVSSQTLKLDGTEFFSLSGLEKGITPRMTIDLVITRKDGSTHRVPVTLRIDTPIEVDYYRHGGILPFVLRQLVA